MNISNSSREEVVLTQNGEVYNPITNIGIASLIMKIVCCSIGIPLNISIAVTITCLRRLHRKSRNFFLLGIILSYLSFYIVPIIQLLYWELQTDESLCHAYVATIFVPQGLLLINMLLALIDRYLAINYPLLHREKMTNRLACCLVVTCWILTVFLLKFVYIVGLGTLRCELLLLHVRITLILFMILFVSCTAMNIVIYRQTKILLRESRTVETKRDEGAGVSSDSVTANNQHSTVVTPMSVHVGKKKLGQMEMEATRTLVIGVASLCVMPCLNVIFMATFFACRLVFDQLECSNLNGMGYLIKEISLTPAVYGPVIFLVRNKELRAALTCQIIR